jgi:hypothetical protein
VGKATRLNEILIWIKETKANADAVLEAIKRLDIRNHRACNLLKAAETRKHSGTVRFRLFQISLENFFWQNL